MGPSSGTPLTLPLGGRDELQPERENYLELQVVVGKGNGLPWTPFT